MCARSRAPPTTATMPAADPPAAAWATQWVQISIWRTVEAAHQHHNRPAIRILYCILYRILDCVNTRVCVMFTHTHTHTHTHIGPPCPWARGKPQVATRQSAPSPSHGRRWQGRASAPATRRGPRHTARRRGQMRTNLLPYPQSRTKTNTAGDHREVPEGVPAGRHTTHRRGQNRRGQTLHTGGWRNAVL